MPPKPRPTKSTVPRASTELPPVQISPSSDRQTRSSVPQPLPNTTATSQISAVNITNALQRRENEAEGIQTSLAALLDHLARRTRAITNASSEEAWTRAISDMTKEVVSTRFLLVAALL